MTTRGENERIAVLETQMYTVIGDVKDIKRDVKHIRSFVDGSGGAASFVNRLVPWVAILVSLAAIVRSA